MKIHCCIAYKVSVENDELVTLTILVILVLRCNMFYENVEKDRYWLITHDNIHTLLPNVQLKS